MYPQRLPVVNGDDGTWGNILVQYLQLQHFNDGTNNPVNGGHQNVTITAGTTTAAPLTFTSGVNLTTPVAGSMEFTTDTLYFTITTGTTRRKVALYDGASPGATGDVYYLNSSGVFSRLGIGSSGQSLRVSSGLPAWGDSSGGLTTNTQSGTTYTVSSTDAVVFASAASNNITVTLPLSSGLAGYRFYIKRIDSSTTNTVTIARTSPDTIDGLTSFTLDLQYTAITVVSNGSAWYIL